ncbi:MAG: LamG domain-containing protein [Bacillota bacterium]|nr:LamG domain-containing protein [Bacillota bacterium]
MVINTMSFFAPVMNMALKFDGKSQYISIPNSEYINFNTNDNFTIELWTKLENNDSQESGSMKSSILEKSSSESAFPYAIRYYNSNAESYGKVIVCRSDGKNKPSLESVSSINDGRFHHLCFVRRINDKNKGELSLYIDGIEECKTDDTTSGNTANSSRLYIGKPHNNSLLAPFSGIIDHLRIWNGALTASQISTIMYSAFGGGVKLKHDNPDKEIILVGNWKLNEGYGLHILDDAKHNNGSLGEESGINAPEWVVNARNHPIQAEYYNSSVYNLLSSPDGFKKLVERGII